MTTVLGRFVTVELAFLGLCELALSFLVIYAMLAMPEAASGQTILSDSANLAAVLAVTIMVTAAVLGLYGPEICVERRRLLINACVAGLLAIPTNFSYWAFAVLVFVNGLGGGLFTAPNTAVIMSSVPASLRGVASGMRATFVNCGMVLSIGVFFSLMVAGLAGTLPSTLDAGLTAQGVPESAAHAIATLPPVGVLFAAFLGYNPIQQLLGPAVLGHLPPANAAALTDRQFFPDLLSQPFHHGLNVVFTLAILMGVVGAVASLVSPRRPVEPVEPEEIEAALIATTGTLAPSGEPTSAR